MHAPIPSSILSTVPFPSGALLVVPFAVTSFVAFLLVATAGLHGRHSFDSSEGVQKVHVGDTPRIGGLAILLGLVAALLLVPAGSSRLFLLTLVAAVPAFVSGFVEDITGRVGVNERLLASMLSGFFAWLLTGYRLDHVALPFVDPLLSLPVISVAFTAFAVGGVANSLNIIDGFNGLAGGSAAIGFGALAFIAAQVGDSELAMLALAVLLVLLGFLLLNFPFGLIFMGDGGAYLVGFLLAWVSVMLPARNPEVSVWAPVLVAAYPVVETLFSMIRRLSRRMSPGEPDRAHLHSLIHLNIVERYFSGLDPRLSNGLVSPFCWTFAAAPALAACLLYGDASLLRLLFIGLFFFYALLYRFVVTRRVQSPSGAAAGR
ncbi:glycosyltransferase [Chlorobium sp. N1]|uniref:MraY family glycosyltransferase n=1 Tax=Chlorobium sp. N1 TaxID=2491138 RepID=UPI00103BE7B2|nr:glycosyltransferase [Chlorobium sp. N1]TCD46998.1 glycosyl transferase [Chlorobium sp. N1]